MASPSREAAILSEKFPDNVSVSELCDCGKHKRRKEQMPKPRRLKSYPDTSDYKDTFIAARNHRPRSSKRPPPATREFNPPPMTFGTNQRDAYQAPGTTGRPPDFAPKDIYESPSIPVEQNSYYSQEFTPKQQLPEIRRFEPPRENFRRTSAKFDGRTTYKDNHKHWVGRQQKAFGELPSFAGSILFPTSENVKASETQHSFQGEFARRPDLIKLNQATIKMEGDHDMLTTHRDTYKDIKGDYRPPPIINQSEISKHRPRGKLQSETQFMSDYPAYAGGQPKPPPPARPAPDTLDLKFDNLRSFDTEQRRTYRGHDVLQNPKLQLCKVEEQMYHPPPEPVEAETCNRRDYRPIDLSRAYVSRAVVPVQRVQKSDARFDDKTTTKEFFKNWGPSQRVRHGDFHENRPYMPSKSKFDVESIAQSSYVPKKHVPMKDFKPDNKPASKEGNFDFNTVTHVTYQKPEVKPCRAAVYLMQKEIKELRRQQAVDRSSAGGQPTGLTIAAN